LFLSTTQRRKENGKSKEEDSKESSKENGKEKGSEEGRQEISQEGHQALHGQDQGWETVQEPSKGSLKALQDPSEKEINGSFWMLRQTLLV